ncbi:MAG: restriction endonuclease subunit S [Chloroflexi bacterium]|nr:restriction endonuclease subunit S [Chloroflexota bacterium]
MAEPSYIFQAVTTDDFVRRVSDHQRGSSYPAVTDKDILSQIIPFPPLPEQKAIARVLSTIQKATETQDKVIAAARELKKSLMRHLFTYGPVPVAEAERVPLKQTEVGPIPLHWKVVRLGELSEIRYGLGQPPAASLTGVPIIRATNIKRGKIELAGLLRVEPKAIPLTRKPFLKSGDIIVVRSGAYTGDVALITPEWEDSVAGYDLVVSPAKRLDSSYLAHLLLTNSIQGYFRSQRDRSAQPHLNAYQLAATLVQVPNITEQEQIAWVLSGMDRKLEIEGNRKAALQALFKTMLHHLMTGKVRVKELSPA